MTEGNGNLDMLARFDCEYSSGTLRYVNQKSAIGLHEMGLISKVSLRHISGE
jgi:hypothetical protein